MLFRQNIFLGMIFFPSLFQLHHNFFGVITFLNQILLRLNTIGPTQTLMDLNGLALNAIY